MSTFLLTFAIPDGTGASRMLLQYGTALTQAGHQVILAYGDSSSQGNALPAAGERILDTLRQQGVDCQPVRGYRSIFSRQLARSLEVLGAERKVETVIGFQQLDRKYALATAGKLGVSCAILALNKHKFWGVKPVAWFKRRVYERLLRRHASKVVCCSNEIRSEIEDDFGIPSSRTIVIPNGVKVPEFLLDADRRVDLRTQFGVQDGQILLTNIGRIDMQKGQDVLLRSLAKVKEQLPRWKLLLVGDVVPGPNAERMNSYRKQLEQIVEHHGMQEHVVFLGWRDDLREILTATDLYLQPSRWEGWPLVNLQAMAEGKPLLASDCIETPEGFESGVHGTVFQSENELDLASKLKQLCQMSNLPEMGIKCRELVKARYDITALSQRFVACMESLGQ